MQEQLNQMMLMMQEVNQRSEESMKAMKEVETILKVQIEELKKENAQLRSMVTKLVHANHQAKNVQVVEE